MENDFYALQLDDYSLPGFVSGGKYYYGSLTELDDYFKALEENEKTKESHEEPISAYKEFKNGNTDVKHTVAYNKVTLIEPVKIYSMIDVFASSLKWMHSNTYGLPYFMKADALSGKVIWIKHGSSYLRCVKPEFSNLSYSGNLENGVDYTLLRSAFWGQPEILYQRIRSNGEIATASRFFLKERAFPSKKEMTRDVKAMCDIDNFTEFCNEIFADG